MHIEGRGLEYVCDRLSAESVAPPQLQPLPQLWSPLVPKHHDGDSLKAELEATERQFTNQEVMLRLLCPLFIQSIMLNHFVTNMI